MNLKQLKEIVDSALAIDAENANRIVVIKLDEASIGPIASTGVSSTCLGFEYFALREHPSRG